MGFGQVGIGAGRERGSGMEALRARWRWVQRRNPLREWSTTKVVMLGLGLFELVIQAPSFALVDGAALKGSLSIPDEAVDRPAGRAFLVLFIIYIGLARLGFCFSEADSLGGWTVLVLAHVVETIAWYWFAFLKLEGAPQFNMSCVYQLCMRAINAYYSSTGGGAAVGAGATAAAASAAAAAAAAAKMRPAAAGVVIGSKSAQHDHNVLVVLPAITLLLVAFGGKSGSQLAGVLWRGLSADKTLKTVDQVIIFMQVPENMKEEEELVMVLEKVGSLCVGNDTNCVSFAKSADFWQAFKTVLQSSRLSSSVALAKFGSRAVNNLARNNDDNKKLLGQSGACEAVTRAMRTHSTDVEVAQWGSRAVGNLAFNADNRTKLGGAGACEELTRALKLHPSNHSVAQWGCRAVTYLAHLNPSNKAKLGTAGAAEEVTEALRTHLSSSYPDVAEQGCVAIQELADGNAENKLKLRAAGAEAAVALVLASADMRENVKIEARNALKKLY